MATLTFSPPIIKLALLLVLAVVTFVVTAWLIRSDVKEMAERAEREWGRGGKEKGPKRVVSNVKSYDHARTDQQIKDDYNRARAREDDLDLKSYPVPKGKGRDRGQKKGSYKGNKDSKGGGAR